MRKVSLIFSLTIMIILGLSGFSQTNQLEDPIKLTKSEKKKYVGVYEFGDNNSIKTRKIILEEDRLYYVVDDQTKIPLKPESKLKFNLYPSKTYLYFEFDQNMEIKKVTIKKGSGGTMTGVKKSIN